MGCHTNTSHHSCSCQQVYQSNPVLWSKKKKLNHLKHMLDCLKDKEQEIQEAIADIEKS